MLTKESYAEMKRRGLSDERIAGELKLPLSRIRKFKRENDLTGVNVRADEILTVRDTGGNAIMRGTRAEIAAAMGWKPSTIRSYRKRTVKGEETPYKILKIGEK